MPADWGFSLCSSGLPPLFFTLNDPVGAGDITEPTNSDVDTRAFECCTSPIVI